MSEPTYDDLALTRLAANDRRIEAEGRVYTQANRLLMALLAPGVLITATKSALEVEVRAAMGALERALDDDMEAAEGYTAANQAVEEYLEQSRRGR